MIKPLDFVRTPKGQIAIVGEVALDGGASIWFIGDNDKGERNAWWRSDELEAIDSLPLLLAKGMAHPFGNGKEVAEKTFGR